MSKEKITSIVLIVVLIIIVIVLTIIGIIALKNSKNSNEPETTTGEVIKSSSKGSDKNGGISIQEQNVPERSASKKKMMELIKGGTTVLYVSHSLESIEKLCTKVVWLEHGEIIDIGKPSKICREYYWRKIRYSCPWIMGTF